MCDVLKVDMLSSDFYAVFKNITKYSIWELTELLKLNNLTDTEEDIQILNSKRKVLSEKDFKKHKKEFIIRHKENYGIPQGSAISAVLANVYMIVVDEQMYNLANKYKGLYMRYSDDFIIILPGISEDDFREILNSIIDEIKQIPNLILQPDKTQIYKSMTGVLLSAGFSTTMIKARRLIRHRWEPSAAKLPPSGSTRFEMAVCFTSLKVM